MTEWWAVVLVVAAGMVGSLGPIFFKKASALLFRHFYKNVDLIFGFFMYGLSTVLFIPALKGGDLSVLYPIVSLVYIWIAFLSVRFLKEKMNVYKWFGIILIVLGITAIGLGS